jgi:hypothetical protein
MKTAAEVFLNEWMKNLTEEERARMDEAANRVWGFIRKATETTEVLANAAIRAAERADIGHDRRMSLRLYHQRHSWKTADLPRLRTYRLNKAARKHVAVLKESSRLGRGSTVPYQSLVELLAEVGRYFARLHDPSTPGHERVRLLKRHNSWWPQFIEMTYRGEYERLRQLGGPAPSEQAEKAVADAFFISCSSVRRNCIHVRRDPASRNSLSDSMTVAEFDMWKQSGHLPHHAADETVY